MARRHSSDVKAEAVARALSGDVSKRTVARDLGISETTLYRWIEAAGQEPSNVAHLRIAPEPAPPSKQRPKTVLEAAESGSRLEELQAMQRRIARAIDDANTPARDLAALSRRQLEIGREIEAIQVAEDEERSVVSNRGEEDWDADAI